MVSDKVTVFLYLFIPILLFNLFVIWFKLRIVKTDGSDHEKKIFKTELWFIFYLVLIFLPLLYVKPAIGLLFAGSSFILISLIFFKSNIAIPYFYGLYGVRRGPASRNTHLYNILMGLVLFIGSILLFIYGP